MLADFMSKPLQGKLFTRFRNVNMGWQHISTLFKPSSSNEERVKEKGFVASETLSRDTTYAENVRASRAVHIQNDIIAKGGTPTD